MAVINRTDCFIKCIRLVQGTVLFLVVSGVVNVTYSNPLSDPEGCVLIKKDVSAKGLPVALVLDQPANGEYFFKLILAIFWKSNNIMEFTLLSLI